MVVTEKQIRAISAACSNCARCVYGWNQLASVTLVECDDARLPAIYEQCEELLNESLQAIYRWDACYDDDVMQFINIASAPRSAIQIGHYTFSSYHRAAADILHQCTEVGQALEPDISRVRQDIPIVVTGGDKLAVRDGVAYPPEFYPQIEVETANALAHLKTLTPVDANEPLCTVGDEYLPNKGEVRLIDLLLTDGDMALAGIVERLECSERAVQRWAKTPIKLGYIITRAGRYSATKKAQKLSP